MQQGKVVSIKSYGLGLYETLDKLKKYKKELDQNLKDILRLEKKGKIPIGSDIIKKAKTTDDFLNRVLETINDVLH